MVKSSKNAVGMVVSKYKSVLRRMFLKNATRLTACCLLAVMPMMTAAEDITYGSAGDGDNKLKNAPAWYLGGYPLSLFPNAYTGNTITINYNPLNPPANVYNPNYVLGGLHQSNAVTNNTVYMLNGEINNIIYGGYSESGLVSGNSVYFSGGKTGYIYGGCSEEGSALDNQVTISGNSKISADVFGGANWGNGNATGNSTVISDSTVDSNIYGGYSLGGNANYNNTIISNSIVLQFVFGGSSAGGDAVANSVKIYGGAIGNDVCGGETNAAGALAKNNEVIISGGTIEGHVTGGYSDNGSSIGNTVIISAGEIKKDIYGGEGWGDVAENNQVIIAGGKVVEVYGGAGDGNAIKNSVTISGGTVTGEVTGGYSENGSSIGNIVAISGGIFDGEYIFGGDSFSGDAIKNTVTISGSPSLINSNIYGGLTHSGGDDFSGNTLNLNGFQGKVASIHNFQYHSFLLPASLKSGDTLLTTSDWDNCSTANITVANVNIASGSAPLKAGDTINLIKVEGGTLPTNALTLESNSIQGMKGISLIYNFGIHMDTANNALILKVGNVQAHPQTKALSEGRIAGMAFLNQGSDLIAGEGIANARFSAEKANDKSTVFGIVSAGSSSYKTGSHADVTGKSILTGINSISYLENGSLLKGVFLEAGWGNYDAYNNFGNIQNVISGGDTSYYGLGAFLRRDLVNGNYLEGSLRGGKARTTFSSRDFQGYTGKSQNASYTSSTPYYGIHLGLGRTKVNGNNTVDYYTKYFWTHQNGDNVSVLNDPVSFSATNSSRLRSGVRLSQVNASGKMTTYAGMAYEYEFDGKANATVYGFDMAAPSLRGGTGILELGMSYKNSPESKNVLQLNLQGYAGKRQGLSGNIQFKRVF